MLMHILLTINKFYDSEVQSLFFRLDNDVNVFSLCSLLNYGKVTPSVAYFLFHLLKPYVSMLLLFCDFCT